MTVSSTDDYKIVLFNKSHKVEGNLIFDHGHFFYGYLCTLLFTSGFKTTFFFQDFIQ